ncbi:MAG: methyltransferase domain-containing protein [Planctomycetaceae bacterium]|nr:methyltransferase domain-containing protein [Planctomycetaceae bacterium]
MLIAEQHISTMRIPPYFDALLQAWEMGATGRCVHLGYWDLDDRTANVSTLSLSDAQQALDARMTEFGDVQNGQTVLDVACGFGGLLQALDDRFREMQFTGVNIDRRQLDVCRSIRFRGQNSIHWQEADACCLPFSDQQFDRVFCIEAMFHFASRRTFLMEMLRVLKPGGRFVLTDIRIDSTGARERLPAFAVHALLSDGYGPWPDPWCTSGTASEVCRQLGAHDVRTHDLTENTRPGYEQMISGRAQDDVDPGNPLMRSLLMLRWLHLSGLLRYEAVTGYRALEVASGRNTGCLT